mmetsp:Transcript_134164/g.246632  ORF Transcript_134164/g.246632 Transcript_134164/m.246632 type:complete len:662 (-) Transcript_134164:36-2021(-)
MRPSLSAAALIIGTTGEKPGSRSGQRDAGLERPSSATKWKMACRTPRRAYSFTQLQAMTKLEFKYSGGNYGMIYDGNIVVHVSDQAKALGVKVGWKITMIDNKVCNNSEDVRNHLQEALWQWRSCYVWFVTDKQQVKAELAAKRLAAEQAEVERLDKLPYSDCQDPNHLEQLKLFIQFQGYIEHREDRAITLQQFKTILKWVKERCHRWRDADPPHLSRTSRMHLTMDFMNTYHLNHWFVKPATIEKDCALTEMLTNVKQPADWFVIHWWGDRLKDVLRCLELQIATRELDDKTAFWFGAFACRQHSMMDNVGPNPEATCYFRAMRQANFQVLLILDIKTEHSGPATPFRRAWCGYELSMCLGSAESSLVLDVASCEGGEGNKRPSLITHDLTTAERNMEYVDPGSGHRAKEAREKTFSLELVALAMGVQVQSGKTLRAQDKQQILNSIVQRDLDEPALVKHEAYNRYNQRLRALFALGFWRRVMLGSGEQSEIQQLQQKICRALKDDEWRESLDLNMAFMNSGDTDQKMVLVSQSIPPNLKHFKLDLKGTDIGNETIIALASALPRSVESMQLDLSHNPKIDNVGVEMMTNRLPPGLANSKIDLEGTGTGKQLKEKASDLSDLKQHFVTEASKGNWCNTVSLCPSPTGRMETFASKFKIK